MKVFIVHAHPEPRSLNGSLLRFAVETLTRAGHEVQVSDLYAMNWKASADAGDFPRHDPAERLVYAKASGKAFAEGTQSPEVAAEQRKLLWADAVLLQFPLWWFHLPAILKGWVDRVFAYGFAYGVGQHGGARWGDRYGEGKLAGKRSMLLVTAGGRERHYSPRGVNGAIEDILFPIHHGILYYPGMDVLPPFVLYQTGRLVETDFEAVAVRLAARLHGLFTDTPIPFRSQNGGDYDDQQELKPGLEGSAGGLRIHERNEQR